MRQFYFSYKQVKYGYSLRYAVSCGRFNITVNRDYLHAQNQGKFASVCLQQFSSNFETTIIPFKLENISIYNVTCLKINAAKSLWVVR